MTVFNRWALEDFLRLNQITKSELASRAGVAPSYITELLNGTKKSPSRSVLRRVADALNVSPLSLTFEGPEAAA